MQVSIGKYVIGLCAVLMAAAGHAQPASYKLTCGTGADHAMSLEKMRYGNSAYGFDLNAAPQMESGTCTGEQAFFISLKEPEGNYRVTVELGGPDAASTTVKAESRRLMLQDIETKPGQRVKRSFLVNVRTPEIDANERVRLKPREIGNLDWDEKLTLEFTGPHPAVQSIEVVPAHVPTLYLAGDSTVVDQDNEPWAAWGQMIPLFFTDKLAVANEAESGETIRSFESERRWDKLTSTLQRGDWVMIQFAHNDQKPGRGFVSIPQYEDSLRKYIRIIRSKGAHPVLVTSMNRRSFDEDGKIRMTLAPYPEEMRRVAQQEHVQRIDLNAMSKTVFEAMGPEGTLKAFVHYPANTYPGQTEALADDTHFNSFGALELAKCVVQGIRDGHLGMSKYLKKGLPTFDPAHPDPPTILIDSADPFVTLQKPYER